MEVQLVRLRMGSTLYHSGPALQGSTSPATFYPQPTSAFAAGNGSPMHEFRATRQLRLISKADAAWVATRGMKPRGAWPGFGNPDADLDIARLLQRRTAPGTASTWAAGLDGWVHDGDPLEGERAHDDTPVGEVMLCNPNAVLQKTALPVTAATATTRTACDARQTVPVEGNAAMATRVSRLLETPGCAPNRATVTSVAHTVVQTKEDLHVHLASSPANASDDSGSDSGSPAAVNDGGGSPAPTGTAAQNASAGDISAPQPSVLPLHPRDVEEPEQPLGASPIPSVIPVAAAARLQSSWRASRTQQLRAAQRDLDLLISDANSHAVARAITLATGSSIRGSSELLTRSKLVEIVKAEGSACAAALVAARRQARRQQESATTAQQQESATTTQQQEPPSLAQQLEERRRRVLDDSFQSLASKLGSGSERDTLRGAAVACGEAHIREMESADAAYRATLITNGPHAPSPPGPRSGPTLSTGRAYRPKAADHVFDASAEACSPAQFTDVRFLTDHDSDYSGLTDIITALLAGDTGGGQTVLGEALEVEIRKRYPGAIKDVSEDEGMFSDQVLEVAGLGAVNHVLRTVSLRFKLADGVIRAQRVPVISGFYGFILGNQFNRSVSAEYIYSNAKPDAIFCYTHDYLGVMQTTMEYLSQRVEFGSHGAFATMPTAGAVVPVAFTQGDDNTVPAAAGGKSGRHWFKLRAHTGLENGATVLMEPLSEGRFTTKGLLGVISEQTVQDGHVWFEVMNVNPYPVTVGELTAIARFRTTRIAPESTVDEVMASIHIGPALAESPAHMSRLRDLVTKHLAVFRKSLRTSYTHAVKHRIVLKPGYTPRRDAPIIRRSPRDEERYTQAAQQALDNGTSSVVTGELLEFICNQILVPKFDENGVRQKVEREVMDHRGLNDNTADPGWPLPDILRNLARLCGMWFFSLDLYSGFTQVELEEASKLLCAYYTPLGVLMNHRMSQGLKGAPATFCRCVSRVMTGVEGVYCYFDDLAGGAWDFDGLFGKLDITLTRLGEANLGVKAKKLWVGFASLAVTGFIVSRDGHRPNPERTRPIAEWTVQMLRDDPKVKVPQWLGLMNTYNRFIPAFALLAGIIRESIAIGADTQAVMSSLRFRVAFDMLCTRLTDAVACAVPDYARRFYIMTDAALSGAATAVLYQVEDDGSVVIIALWSEMFGVNDKNAIKVASRDFECYAVHQACCVKFAWALDYAESETVVYCDCKSLETMMTTRFQRESAALRMANELSARRFRLVWRPGHLNSVPDALGRVVARAANKMLTLISLSRSHPSPSALPPPPPPPPSRVPSLLTLATQAAVRSRDPSFGTLVNEAHSARDERGCGRTVSVQPLFTDPQSGQTLSCPHGFAATTLAPAPPPTTFSTMTLSTTRASQRGRVASALIHPARGVLVCVGADGSVSFPGGAFTRPGSTYRSAAAALMPELFHGPGDHLSATVRRCKPAAELRFESTVYVVHVIAERLSAGALEILGDGATGSLLPLADLGSAAFCLQDDIRCAGRLMQLARASEGSSALSALSLKSAADAVSSPAPFSLNASPRGPIFITSADILSEWASRTARDIEAVRHSGLSAVIAVDLEGDLRANGRIELIQICARCPVGESLSCIAVIDVRMIPASLAAGAAVRLWLEDPDIAKSLHSAIGDCSALYSLFGIRVARVADSVVGDCLVRGVRHGTARGLAAVTEAYTGHVLAKGVTHEHNTWTVRPLADELIEYSAMDVAHGPQLHCRLEQLCVEAGVSALLYQLSADRVPPRSLPPTDPAYEPPTHLVLLIHDGSRMVLLLSPDGSLCLPSMAYDPSMASRIRSRACAMDLWRTTLGPPTRPLSASLSALRRAERVGPILIHAAVAPPLDDRGLSCAALLLAFDATPSRALGYELQISAACDLDRAHLPEAVVLASEWVVHTARVECIRQPAAREDSDAAPDPAGPSSADGGPRQSLTCLTQGGTGSGITLATAPAPLVHAMICDGTFVLLLRHRTKGLVLPCLPPNG